MGLNGASRVGLVIWPEDGAKLRLSWVTLGRFKLPGDGRDKGYGLGDSKVSGMSRSMDQVQSCQGTGEALLL